MSRRGARPIFYVCAALSKKVELLTKVINASTSLEAKKLFKTEFNVDPSQIMGPFYKKQTQIIETTRVLKFAKQAEGMPAIYNEWLVDVFLLSDPADHAYLIFQNRTDGKKAVPPQGTITVPVTDLRFITK